MVSRSASTTRSTSRRRPVQPANVALEEAEEGGVGAADRAVPVDRGDGDRRVVEEAGETDFGGPQRLRPFLARAPVEDNGAGRARGAARSDRDAVEKPHRQALAATLDEIEVDRLGAIVAALGNHAGEQGHAFAPDQIAKRQRPRLEVREVDAKPIREGGVEVDDAAIRLGREEAGGSVVEIVDGVLEFLEHRLLLRPLAADVGDSPGRARTRAAWSRHRPRPDSVPAGAAAARSGKGLRQADLLLGRPAVAHRLRNPVDRLGGLGISGKEPLDGADFAIAVRSRQLGIGMVGVEDLAGPVGEHHPFAEGVEIAAGDVHPRLPPADADQAEREQKQHRHADDGEHGEQAEHQRLHAIALDEDEADRHTDQAEGEDDQAPGATDAVRPVAGQVEPWRFVDPIVHPGTFISHHGDTRPPNPRKSKNGTFGSQPRRSAIRPLADPVLISRE